MQFLTLYWWEWLAYLLGFSSFIINGLWLVTTLKEKQTPSGGTTSTVRLTASNSSVLDVPDVKARGRVTVWIGIPVLALGIGAAAGYAIRDHQLISGTRTYFGVSVLSQQSDHRYMVRVPGYVKPYDWEFCHPLKMPGPLIDIKYEQRFGCKAVNGVGFVQIHQEKNNNELSNGRNPAAAEPSTFARLERR